MLNRISFYALKALSRVVSLLPFPVIYFISDCAYFLVYHLAGYRKKVVRANLAHSFPEKPVKELRQIEHKFYHFFCDYALESMVLPFISAKSLDKRFTYVNPGVVDAYYEQRRSVILVASHYGNWEMALQLPQVTRHKIFGVYKPQSNKGVDAFFIRTRERFGAEAVPMNNIVKRLVTSMEKGIPAALYLLSDQRPFHLNVRYWTMFLNQETPILLGAERIGCKYNLPVFYLDVQKKGRGKYELTFRLLEENPASTKEYEVTEKHVRFLESVIRKDPTIWLWTHRRWRHKTMEDFLRVMGKTLDSPGVAYNKELIKIP